MPPPPRVVPHPFDLDAGKAVTDGHQRGNRLAGRQVEDQLVHLDVTTFPHDLHQADVSADPTQRRRDSTQRSRPVRQQHPQKQHPSPAAALRATLSANEAAAGSVGRSGRVVLEAEDKGNLDATGGSVPATSTGGGPAV